MGERLSSSITKRCSWRMDKQAAAPHRTFVALTMPLARICCRRIESPMILRGTASSTSRRSGTSARWLCARTTAVSRRRTFTMPHSSSSLPAWMARRLMTSARESRHEVQWGGKGRGMRMMFARDTTRGHGDETKGHDRRWRSRGRVQGGATTQPRGRLHTLQKRASHR